MITVGKSKLLYSGSDAGSDAGTVASDGVNTSWRLSKELSMTFSMIESKRGLFARMSFNAKKLIIAMSITLQL